MRWLEFTGFYIVLPVVLALVMPHRMLFPVLLLMTALGLWLLARTEGVDRRALLRGRAGIDWPAVAVFAVAVAVLSAGVVWATVPQAFLALPRQHPGFFAVIVVLYPILSALPQELLFRVLYFRRYGALVPRGWAGLAVNGAVFSLAHLMFWSWIVAAMTFVGGVIFAWAYEKRGNLPMAFAMHAVAGWIIFGMGLGAFFYLGNVHRPF